MAEILTANLAASEFYHGPEQFEQGALDKLRVAAQDCNVKVEPTYHPHAFPDIRVKGWGVEVKYSKRDTWNAAGNSIFRVHARFERQGHLRHVRQGRRCPGGAVGALRKLRGPCARVECAALRGEHGHGEQRATAVQAVRDRLRRVRRLDEDAKMEHVRSYWRKRLPPGDRLWWLEPEHTLPLNVRLYTNLSRHDKRVLRTEAALLCPKIVQGKVRGKYAAPAIYALTHWGVLCPQARDLFSAGSVAQHVTPLYPGEPYISRALRDIEQLMTDCAPRLSAALFEEYWGEPCQPQCRIARWLALADRLATDWKRKPSAVLFKSLAS